MQSRKVLILNADYRAFSVCSVYKAFLLVYLNKAEIIKKSENAYLRTVSRSYEMPSIIKLHNYVNIPYKGVIMTRQNIFKRDGGKCVYCSSKDNLTIDHVLPRSRGGSTSWNNLVTACKTCNSRKGDFLPEEIDMFLPYKPFKPSFIMFLRDFSGLREESWMPYLQVAR
ncbi:MAG: HNH endonuclease [Bacteroidota bacterium]